MLNGFTGLLDSKKALAGGMLIVCATVLVGVDKMTVDAWTTFCQYVFTVWAGAETANGVAATLKGHGVTRKAVAEKTTEKKDKDEKPEAKE